MDNDKVRIHWLTFGIRFNFNFECVAIQSFSFYFHFIATLHKV